MWSFPQVSLTPCRNRWRPLSGWRTPWWWSLFWRRLSLFASCSWWWAPVKVESTTLKVGELWVLSWLTGWERRDGREEQFLFISSHWLIKFLLISFLWFMFNHFCRGRRCSVSRLIWPRLTKMWPTPSLTSWTAASWFLPLRSRTRRCWNPSSVSRRRCCVTDSVPPTPAYHLVSKVSKHFSAHLCTIRYLFSICILYCG